MAPVGAVLLWRRAMFSIVRSRSHPGRCCYGGVGVLAALPIRRRCSRSPPNPIARRGRQVDHLHAELRCYVVFQAGAAGLLPTGQQGDGFARHEGGDIGAHAVRPARCDVGVDFGRVDDFVAGVAQTLGLGVERGKLSSGYPLMGPARYVRGARFTAIRLLLVMPCVLREIYVILRDKPICLKDLTMPMQFVVNERATKRDESQLGTWTVHRLFRADGTIVGHATAAEIANRKEFPDWKSVLEYGRGRSIGLCRRCWKGWHRAEKTAQLPDREPNA